MYLFLFSGLDHLIGSPLLRAHMHGYYMDVRLYRKAVSGLWQIFAGVRDRSVCFWASQIWIRKSDNQILPSNSKKILFLLFCDFFLTFFLWRMM
jgi:hypothetical protein